MAAATCLTGVVAAITLGGTSVAGADTPGYTLDCNLSGLDIPIPNTVTTGTLPSAVQPNSNFKLTNYAMNLTMPDTPPFNAAAGLTISGTYVTTLTATGAAPASRSVTFNIPQTTFPTPFPAAGVSMTITAPDQTSKAGGPGTAKLSTGTSGTLNISVAGSPPLPLSCTNPAKQIAQTAISSSAPKPTATALTSSSNPVQVGHPVTFTATVTSAPGAGTPTGTVSFTTNGHALCSKTLDTDATASCSTTYSSSQAGLKIIQATYSGSSAFAGSSDTLRQQVNGGSGGQGSALFSGQSLGPNQSLVAGPFRLTMQKSDGNLVEYEGTTPLWASNTEGNPNARIFMQSDGNLVIYNSTHSTALWNTGTEGNPGAKLFLQSDDANIVVYNSTHSAALWASGVPEIPLGNS